MMKNAKPINELELQNEIKRLAKDKTNSIVRHALSNTSVEQIAKSQDRIVESDFSFSLDIKTMSVTNQKKSGRCWIFAATNVLREIIAKKLNLSSFELSQSYIAFYDKLEKANFELEAIIDLLGVEHDDRTLSHVLSNTFGDGGQWDMFVNLVKKYGVVPKNVMPETFQSSNTGSMSQLISTELRKFASVATQIFKEKGLEEVRKEKENLLKRITSLMVASYGILPSSFDFEYVDKDNNYHLEKGFTPKSFFDKYIGQEIDEYVSIINAPTKDKPYNKSFTIDYLGNVVGGKLVKHLNLSMERMKKLIISQLKDGEIVWFGSDVAFFRDREGGVWDDKAYDYETTYELGFKLDKGLALDYGINAMNHAMCITGVNLNDLGVATKWKIENSWGSESGKSGYYFMSDTWFDQYTFQAVVKKKYLTSEELKAYETSPIHLKPWDPMGSLAD